MCLRIALQYVLIVLLSGVLYLLVRTRFEIETSPMWRATTPKADTGVWSDKSTNLFSPKLYTFIFPTKARDNLTFLAYSILLFYKLILSTIILHSILCQFWSILEYPMNASFSPNQYMYPYLWTIGLMCWPETKI